MKTMMIITVLVIGLSGCRAGVPEIIVYQYDYQAKPPAGLAPGTPPSSPEAPSAIDYQTIYGSAFDDPSLVIFVNNSYRKVKIEIDEKDPIFLEAYGATANIHLGLGDHQIRVTIEKPTAVHGIWQVVRLFAIRIQPEGRSQIIHIRDPSSDDYGYYGWAW